MSNPQPMTLRELDRQREEAERQKAFLDWFLSLTPHERLMMYSDAMTPAQDR